MIPGGVPKGHKALARLIGAPRVNYEELEAMYDGPIPAEALAGGARAKRLQDALCQFWGLTDAARRCIRSFRECRNLYPAHEYLEAVAGLDDDLAYFLNERRRMIRWINGQIGTSKTLAAAAE